MDTDSLISNAAFWTEVSLLGLVLLLAIAVPRHLSNVLTRMEVTLGVVASRPLLSVVLVFVFTLLVRVVLLPVLTMPQPVGGDYSSLLLQAQTFVNGHFANPSHPLNQFFESVYVHQVPTYGSMYFPGRGLSLALGLILFNSPGAGVLICMGFLAAAMVWMLQAWFSPTLSLLGGLIFALKIALFSFWANSLIGTEFAAIGGTLALGAYGRLRHEVTWTSGVILGGGLFFALVSRPYESILTFIPLGFVTIRRLLKWVRHADFAPVLRLILPVSAFLIAALAVLLVYDKANTGSALKLPYSVNRVEYAGTPAFIFQAASKPTRALPKALADYYRLEGLGYYQSKTPVGFARSIAAKVRNTWGFFVGPLMTIPFLLGLVFLWRNIELAASLLVLFAGFALVQFSWTHYLSPASGIFMIAISAGLKQMRSLGRSGLFMSKALPMAVALSTITPISNLLTGFPSLEPTVRYSCCYYNFLSDRGPIEERVKSQPGRHLVFVNDTVAGVGWDQWVFNDPDIDHSQIVWAHDLGSKENQKLMNYYPERTVWLVDSARLRILRPGAHLTNR